MNWKWEAKVDDSREKQRQYEERKRRALAEAKSADDLRTIARNAQISMQTPSLRQMREAEERAHYEYMKNAQRDLMRQMLMPMWPSVYSWDKAATPAQPPKPLTEDVIIESVIGYRAWNVPIFGGGELQSTTRGERWPICKRLEAECSASPCTGITCSCGIYAYKKLSQAKDGFGPTDPRYSNRIYGTVSLWGRVLECANGYRAQYAYPKEILDTGALARQMASIYHVPILKEGDK